MSIVGTIKMTARQFLELGEDPPGVRLELRQWGGGRESESDSGAQLRGRADVVDAQWSREEERARPGLRRHRHDLRRA